MAIYGCFLSGDIDSKVRKYPVFTYIISVSSVFVNCRGQLSALHTENARKCAMVGIFCAFFLDMGRILCYNVKKFRRRVFWLVPCV